MIDLEKLQLILAGYKNSFSVHWGGEYNEKYKWEAIKQFQDVWNIDADNFGAMFKLATDKTSNLLASGYAYPREMIINFAKADDEATRDMFKKLYDESTDLSDRINEFIARSEELRVKYDDGTWHNHYQNTNAVSTYLWLRYPDKYYIYKYELYRSAARELSADFVPKKNGSAESVIEGFKMYDEICSVIKADNELTSMIQNAITDQCYADPE